MKWFLLEYLVHRLVCALLVVIVEGVHGLLVLPVHPAFFTETQSRTNSVSTTPTYFCKFGEKKWSISTLNCLKTTPVIHLDKLCTHIIPMFQMFKPREILFNFIEGSWRTRIKIYLIREHFYLSHDTIDFHLQ